MRVLRGVPQREAATAGVILADRGARLHGVRHQPVIDDVELGYVLGGLERLVHRGAIAELPLVNGVARCDGVNERCVRALRLGGIRDRRQYLVIDLKFFAGIARLRQRLGDHYRDRIADETGLFVRDGRVRRHLHRRSVLGVDHPAANQGADLVGGKLCTGKHRQHARHAGSRGAVDPLDPGVGMGRAHEVDVALPGPADVGGILPFSGDEAEILLATHRGADTRCAHEDALPDRCYVASSSIRPPGSRGRCRPWPWRRPRLI